MSMTVSEMRRAYLPDRIRLLLVGEAPPEAPERFFYNPVVQTGDSFFLETSKVLFPDLWQGRSAKDVRAMKDDVLARFRADGVYLMDAVDERLPQELSDRECAKIVRANVQQKVAEISGLLAERGTTNTFAVLIKGTVFNALAVPLRAAGVQVPQTGPVPFPGSGQQSRFREAFSQLVA